MVPGPLLPHARRSVTATLFTFRVAFVSLICSHGSLNWACLGTVNYKCARLTIRLFVGGINRGRPCSNLDILLNWNYNVYLNLSGQQVVYAKLTCGIILCYGLK